MRSVAALLLVVVACGGAKHHATAVEPVPRTPTPGESLLALLPEGAEVVVEVDLARLRANAVVGQVATDALAGMSEDARLPGLPLSVQGSPLASGDALVLASYGVGTPQAATIALLETKGEAPNAVRISPNIVALGPDEWVGQVQARATIAGITPDGAPAVHSARLVPSAELMRLRDHAMPAGATGAVLRITARLPFDARISLARQTGLETAPAQLSVWADVADDFAVVIDADAFDPGERQPKQAAHRLEIALRRMLASLADEPQMRALGVSASLGDARFVAQGTWVRTIVAIGPRHLERVVERLRAMLAP